MIRALHRRKVGRNHWKISLIEPKNLATKASMPQVILIIAKAFATYLSALDNCTRLLKTTIEQINSSNSQKMK
mgnify:CR=1 FL=1